ncbi:DUF3322 domain-containing protein [Candidatus Thiosymbion oneisti]|uniref:DUF3322 domain-containing protein n=1 Tax=Candidatus Thiosymbion oneisti TaxID=589554 RepID=UPI000B7D2401|nr:DUF3322 domain-containing protein [Candidatus Thiosymbion oneisti]
MKTPDALRHKLRDQWHNGGIRRRRLLGQDQWPLILAIGKPAPALMAGDIAAVRTHIERWRRMKIGEVRWEAVSYRSLAAAVELPISWVLHSAKQWVEAMADADIRQEYRLLSGVIAAVNPQFHPLIVQQRQQVLAQGAEETIRVCAVADRLTPGCADGRPLRALSIADCDSKFLERNRPLLTRLLELRFGPAVAQQGLEGFLGALDESEHWLLVAPLEPGLLPFEQLRLRSSELRRSALPGSHLMAVENERSLYQLPPLPGTVAVLGAGLNLSWLQAPWLDDRTLAYWGDLDTWGLSMLAMARLQWPHLMALMMDAATFSALAPRHAVIEPVKADPRPPAGLDAQEQALYRDLYDREKGRLEQEFVPIELVHRVVNRWRFGSF